jgi:hypothetical protein
LLRLVAARSIASTPGASDEPKSVHCEPEHVAPTVPPCVADNAESTCDTCSWRVGGFVVDGAAAEDEHAPKHRPAPTRPMAHRTFTPLTCPSQRSLKCTPIPLQPASLPVPDHRFRVMHSARLGP